MDEIIQNLTTFGFTQLEAEVYLFFLQEAPASGYRAAQAIGKPAANTYKAIESLENKGILLVDDSSSKQFRPVPYEELFRRLERDFQERQQQALQQLASVQTVTADDRIYHLRSRDQVMERCRSMLEAAQQVLLLDIFPQPLEELKEAIERTAARGVMVGVQAYAPMEIAGAHLAVTLHRHQILARWPGQWVNLVADGQEMLIAYLSSDGRGVNQAVWSRSAYLAWVYHSGIVSGFAQSSLESLVMQGAGLDEQRDAIRRFYTLFTQDAPGYQSLAQRFSVSTTNLFGKDIDNDTD